MIQSTQHPAPESEPHVLIADDDRSLCDDLGRVFLCAHYTVTLVGNGRAALSVCEGEDEVPRPDVLVLDQLMPGATGLEVASALRASGRHEPVLLISGYQGLVARARELGAIVCEKPVDPGELIALVRRALGGDAPADDDTGASVEELRCVLCGSRRALSLVDGTNDGCLCASCRIRAAPPDELDELGEGD